MNTSHYEHEGSAWDPFILPMQIVPSQYADMRRRKLTPEQELLLAVFYTAWEDLCRFVRNNHARNDVRHRGMRLFYSLDDYFFRGTGGVFSLDNTCDIFEWDIDHLRKIVAATSLCPRRAMRNERLFYPQCMHGHNLTQKNPIRRVNGAIYCAECVASGLLKYSQVQGRRAIAA